MARRTAMLGLAALLAAMVGCEPKRNKPPEPRVGRATEPASALRTGP